jgi:hypothetical protein
LASIPAYLVKWNSKSFENKTILALSIFIKKLKAE